ncbi:hypothetical protein FJZ28_04855 [Candidatus Peregrinibacteria bacterium]|nr:hypothetical protein [Candidatus Peregrinibacteria bacterium]
MSIHQSGGHDDSKDPKPQGNDPIVAGGKHEYDLGDDFGEKIGEHDADEGNV